jgi:hypothetical protein
MQNNSSFICGFTSEVAPPQRLGCRDGLMYSSWSASATGSVSTEAVDASREWKAIVLTGRGCAVLNVRWRSPKSSAPVLNITSSTSSLEQPAISHASLTALRVSLRAEASKAVESIHAVAERGAPCKNTHWTGLTTRSAPRPTRSRSAGRHQMGSARRCLGRSTGTGRRRSRRSPALPKPASPTRTSPACSRRP